MCPNVVYTSIYHEIHSLIKQTLIHMFLVSSRSFFRKHFIFKYGWNRALEKGTYTRCLQFKIKSACNSAQIDMTTHNFLYLKFGKIHTCKVKPKTIIRILYNQIPHPEIKTKRKRSTAHKLKNVHARHVQ